MSTDFMDEIISLVESVLPLSVVKADNDFTCNNVKHVVLFTSDGLPELLETLSDALEVSKEKIVLFFENDRGEIVRIDERTDLRTCGAVRLRAVVGVVPEVCKECKKAFSCGAAPEFHCCVRDEIVPEFSKSSAWGPIERPKSSDMFIRGLVQDLFASLKRYHERCLRLDCQLGKLEDRNQAWSPEIWKRIDTPIIVRSRF